MKIASLVILSGLRSAGRSSRGGPVVTRRVTGGNSTLSKFLDQRSSWAFMSSPTLWIIPLVAGRGSYDLIGYQLIIIRVSYSFVAFRIPCPSEKTFETVTASVKSCSAVEKPHGALRYFALLCFALLPYIFTSFRSPFRCPWHHSHQWQQEAGGVTEAGLLILLMKATLWLEVRMCLWCPRI